MEDDENAGIDWAKIGITVFAGLIIVAVIGAAALYLLTGRLEFPSFTPSIQPQATVNGYEVSLSWNSVSGASSYSIYRSQKEGDLGIAIAKNVTATKYLDAPGIEVIMSESAPPVILSATASVIPWSVNRSLSLMTLDFMFPHRRGRSL